MKLVVEGKTDIKRIISAGFSDYVVAEDQKIIEIDQSKWKDYRKQDVHWDDKQRKIVEKPYPTSPAELESVRQAEVRTQIRPLIDDVLLGNMTLAEAQAEAQAIEAASKGKK